MLVSNFMRNQGTSQKTNFDRFDNISQMKVIDLDGPMGSNKNKSGKFELLIKVN
jgi:hypothetical protein